MINRPSLLVTGIFLASCASTPDGSNDTTGQPGAGTAPGGTNAGGAPSGGAPSGGAPSAGGTSAGGTSAGAPLATGGGAGLSGSSNAGSSPGGAGNGGSSGGSVGGGSSGGPSGTDPGTEGDGDIVAGPAYALADDLKDKGNPTGKTFTFNMRSQDSKIYTGLDTTLNAPKAFTRSVSVYVPAKFKAGTPAPVMVIQDGGGTPGVLVRTAVDNLSIATDPARRLPAFVVVSVANGGDDGKGSQRGLEYDTMSDRYARFIDTEVLPAAASNAQLQAAYPGFTFTKDPEGRGAVGCSSGAAAAFTMAWFRSDLFRRVIGYSATLVAQQDDDAPEKAMFPDGAWDYHSDLSIIANTAPLKPVRIMINANSMDNGYNAAESGKHNWLMANQRTAAALKAKGYHYRYVLGQGLGHCNRSVEQADMAESLLWVWRGYPIAP
jgi:iron(III)-enterobactin esterase